MQRDVRIYNLNRYLLLWLSLNDRTDLERVTVTQLVNGSLFLFRVFNISLNGLDGHSLACEQVYDL